MPMLPLDSERWKKLKTFGGSAENLPPLIEKLRKTPSAELWDAIWSQVVGGGIVEDAAYAVVPHLLEIAKEHDTAGDLLFLGYAANVADAYDGGAGAPKGLKRDCGSALSEAAKTALEVISNQPLDESDFVLLLSIVAGLHGRSALDWPISDLLDGYCVSCLNCGQELETSVREDEIVVGEIGKGRELAPEQPIPEPQPEPEEPWDGQVTPNDEGWMVPLCIHVGQHRVASVLRHLYGQVACPACGDRFALMETIEEEYPGEEEEREPFVPPDDGPPCPECGKPLRTGYAKQCFHCGADWHSNRIRAFRQWIWTNSIIILLVIVPLVAFIANIPIAEFVKQREWLQALHTIGFLVFLLGYLGVLLRLVERGNR